MTSNTILCAPDYLALSAHEFVHHCANLFDKSASKLLFNYPTYTKILGYSCRSLFEQLMLSFSKKEIVVATTPLNHTSFRNIIEKYAKPENIHIIPFNDRNNALGPLPVLKKCAVAVITHMFGQDLDLEPLRAFKKVHNCLVIEDRVQGGTLDKKFSHDVVDISLYSMAMDKRPIALGGGFAHLRNHHTEIIKYLEQSIAQLPEESPKNRFREFLKKIPTYLLYNRRRFLYVFIQMVKWLHRFNPDISILKITQSYRKSNPGFAHNDYMLKPCPGLLKSMHETLHNHRQMERLYARKFKKFFKYFSEEVLDAMFPWYRKGPGNPILTPYNTILLPPSLVQLFLEYFDRLNVSVIANPTYKMFNFAYIGIEKDREFNDGIVYLPAVANMTESEMEFLSRHIAYFYLRYMKPPKQVAKALLRVAHQ